MILPALVLMALVSQSAAYPVYSYNLTVTLSNGGTPLLPGSDSPYYYLLNQNVFRNSSYQEVTLASLKLNGQYVEWEEQIDGDGNPWVHIITDEPLEAHGNATVEMLFNITMIKQGFAFSNVGNLSDIPEGLLEEYPLAGIWDMSKMQNSTQLIETAGSIKGGDENVLSIVFSLLSWFENNMVYLAGQNDPKDVWDTFTTRSGDCDDQANLFVQFCRILGIPAYTSIGPIYIEGRQQESDQNLHFDLYNVGWHGWAMVYLPANGGGVWVPVDLTYFDGGYGEGGHIKSTDPFQHINGSAFAKKYTVQYMDMISIDYINDTKTAKSSITKADVIWIEEHRMLPYSNNVYIVAIPPSIILPLALLIVIAVMLSAYTRSHRVRPPTTASQTP